MNTLIIYDREGKVFLQSSGNYLIPQGGIQFIEVEVPEGKYVDGVDVSVTPHRVILKDIPASETKILNDKIDSAILELTTLIAMGGMPNVQ